MCVIEVSECLGEKKVNTLTWKWHRCTMPTGPVNFESVPDGFTHAQTTHAHIRTDRPPARFGGHVKYTSIIPERHPELEKDTNTHKYPHCGHPVIMNRLDQ